MKDFIKNHRSKCLIKKVLSLLIENTFKKCVKKFGKGNDIGLSLHPQSGTPD